LKDLRRHSFLIVVITTSVVLGATNGLWSLQLDGIKYFGIILLALCLLWSMGKDQSPKLDYFVLIIAFLMLIPSLFFIGSSSSLFLSLGYCFFIPLLAVFGYRLFYSLADLRTIGLTTIVVVALVLLLSLDRVVAQYHASGLGRIRLYGAFNHPNQLGSIALAGVEMLLLHLCLEKKSKKPCSILISICMICFGCVVVFLTDSRVSEVVLFLFLLLVAYSRVRLRLSQKAKILTITIVSAAAVAILFLFVSDYLLTDGNYLARLMALSNYKADSVNGLFGYGMVSSRALAGVSDAASSGSLELALSSILYKAGLGGICAFIVLFFYLVVRSRRQETTSKFLFAVMLLVVLAQMMGESFIINITNFAGIANWLLLSYLSKPPLLALRVQTCLAPSIDSLSISSTKARGT